ncbi:MAG: serpin family protein [Bacteroidetes bacterium]|nr:serpin family protein [Bacteroidota bacterium]
MKRQTAIILTLILTTLFSCKNDRNFPEVKKLSEYKNTQFIPTLEHKISNEKNSVYCATLLFAWDEIRKQINSPLTISDEYFDLKLLNKSTSFENVLKSNEYEVSGEVDGDLITARAEFNKSLPFELKLQSFKNKLTFDGQKVSSFGVNGYDSYEQLKIVKIIYYKNDNNFIIKLLPKDKEHEIILFKTDQTFNSIAEMTSEIEKLTEIGKTEKKNEKISWKYYYNEEDIVIIPKFNFNIETNYTNLEGNRFSSNKQNFQIETALQRTAFILDESGAEIESEAEIAVAVEEIEEEYEKPKPKKMVFDKPFLILIKRIDAKNPYFGLWTTNTELMTKE